MPQEMAAPSSNDQLVGQRHERARRHLHVGGVPAVAGHAVHGDAGAAELGPADATVLAEPAALVVMVHHALADRRLRLGDAGSPLRHHAARLVAGDHRAAAAAEPERRGRAALARGAIRMEIAPAHAGGLHGEDDLARPRESDRGTLAAPAHARRETRLHACVRPPWLIFHIRRSPVNAAGPPATLDRPRRQPVAYARP